jgi:hypothetical protein
MKTAIALGALALAALAGGCQVLLGIDPGKPLLDGGVGGGGGGGGGVRSCAEADADVILCDDFDGAKLDTSKWQNLDETKATLSTDASRVKGGERSLHAHTDSASEAGTKADTVSGMVEHLGALPSHFFVRFFVYVESPAPETGEPEIIVNVQKQGGNGMQLYAKGGFLTFTSWANMPNPLNVPSATAFSLDAWHCLEWEVDRATPRMNVWFDDETVPALGRDDVTMPAYDDVKFGLAFNAPLPAAAHDAWIDDLRIATKKIGCH